MSEFKVGEVAIIVGTFSGRTDVIGMECTVLGYGEFLSRGPNGAWRCGAGYKVSPHGAWTPSPGVRRDLGLIVGPQHLRKKRPPQETTSWSECAWKPEGVTA